MNKGARSPKKKRPITYSMPRIKPNPCAHTARMITARTRPSIKVIIGLKLIDVELIGALGGGHGEVQSLPIDDGGLGV
jgi:hypothetical protein